MSAHTPGPWTDHILDVQKCEIGQYVQRCVEESGGNDFYFVSAPHEDGGSADICHVGNGPKGAANAAYIVRACNAHEELLAALKAMLETYAYNHEKTAQSEGEHMLIACVRDARQAIAKAEGMA